MNTTVSPTSLANATAIPSPAIASHIGKNSLSRVATTPVTIALMRFEEIRRRHLAAQRKCKKLVALHPDLEDARPWVVLGHYQTDAKDGSYKAGDEIRVQGCADIIELRKKILFGENLDSMEARFERGHQEQIASHTTARRRTGVAAAKNLVYELMRKEITAATAVVRSFPSSLREAAAQAAFALKRIQSGAGPQPKQYDEYEAWESDTFNLMNLYAISVLRTFKKMSVGRKPLPAAPKADPIFAAIEHHRAAHAELESNCSKLDTAESHARRAGNKLKARKAKKKLNVLQRAYDRAADALLDISPQTIAGMSALLSYAADHAVRSGWPTGYVDKRVSHGVAWEVILHRKLARELRSISVDFNDRAVSRMAQGDARLLRLGKKRHGEGRPAA